MIFDALCPVKLIKKRSVFIVFDGGTWYSVPVLPIGAADVEDRYGKESKNMKKMICLIAVLVMVFSLCACGAKDAAPAGSEAAAEDGQNPVMNFIGVYGHDRASIMVEADGMENAKITVTWGSSAAENAEWVMSGKFDPETLTVQYTDCVKTVYVWNEQGEVESETVEYENGEGTITFTDGEALSLTWDDAQEHIADGTVFEYASLAG